MLKQNNYRLHLEPSCLSSQIKVIFFLNKKEKIRKWEFQKKILVECDIHLCISSKGLFTILQV